MVEQLAEGLKIKLYADRGYINHKLKSNLKVQGTNLITFNRKNMKPLQISKSDRYHLKWSNKIENFFSLLKVKYHWVMSKARNIEAYLNGIYASLHAYQFCHYNYLIFFTLVINPL